MTLDTDTRRFFEGLLVALGGSIVFWAAAATLVGRIWP